MKKSQLLTISGGFCERVITVVMIFMLVLVWVSANPLGAAQSKDIKVKANMKDGVVLKGKLLEVSGRTLVLYDAKNKKEIQANIDQVRELKIFKKLDILKSILNTTVVGFISTKALFTTNTTAGDYSPAPEIAFSGLGAGAGALGGLLFHPRSKRYVLDKMTDADTQTLLSVLARASSWSDIIGKAWYKDGPLGRLRLSWRPSLNDRLSLHFNGTVTVENPSQPGDHITGNTFLYITQWKKKATLGRVRLDYALADWIALTGEYYAMTENNLGGEWAGGEIIVTLNNQNYLCYNGIFGYRQAKVYLLGASLGIPNANKYWRGVRFEVGLGVNAASLQLTHYNNPNIYLPTTRTFDTVKPAFQVGVSMELFPNDSFTSGIYATYLYAPSTFPSYQTTVNSPFYNVIYVPGETREPAFTSNVDYSYPKSNFNAGGFSLGYFLRIR